MILPKNGSVVVVDDKINEALPLLRELSKLGVSSTYYNGTASMYPDEPLDCVRLVFLDMILDELHATDGGQIVELLLSGLEKLISPNNGPYIIFLWSTRAQEHISDFKERIKSRKTLKCKPIIVVDLVKTSCFGPVEGQDEWAEKDDAMDTIERKLSEELAKYNILPIIFNWENSTRNASTKTTSAISSICDPEPGSWNFHMKRRFSDIACAYSGDHLVDDSKSVTEGAYYCLNKMWMDFAGSLVEEAKSRVNEVYYRDTICFGQGTPEEREEEKIDFWRSGDETNVISKNAEGKYVHYKNECENRKGKDKAELYRKIGQKERLCNNVAAINTLLNIRNYETHSLRPGNAFNMSKKYTELLAAEMKIAPEDLNLVTGFELEVSPMCDYSQNKRKKIRIVPGIMVPISVEFGDAYQKEETKYAFCSDPLLFNGKVCWMVLDFRYLFSKDESYLEKKKQLFSLGDELLSVIIDKMAIQISKGGIVSIRV